MSAIKAKYVYILAAALLLCASCYNPWMADILEKKTVSFNSNGGSYVSSQNLSRGQRVKRPENPAMPGGNFVGWYQDNGAWNYEWDFDTIPHSDLTLYARWNADNSPLHTVTFDADNGTENAAQTVAEGGTAAKPTPDPTRVGHTFDHWFNTATDTEWDFDTAVTANITLKAKWNATVTFDINSGSGSAPSSQTVSSGSNITLPNGSGLTRNGYTFGGWNTNSAGTGTNYNAGSSYTVDNNVTLYAKWLPNSAGITISVGQIEDETFVFDPITISRTGTGGIPVAFTVSINASDYDTITWEVAGVGAGQIVTSTGASFTLDAAEVKYNSLGGHSLILTVTKGTGINVKSIPFTVIQ